MHQVYRYGLPFLAVAGSVLVAPMAHAACAGPEITALVQADGVLVVEGEGFGTDCLDSGPPPEDGEGMLGPPARDVVVVVRHDEREFLVAQGDAAEDYTFHVDVRPPPRAGEVLVEARYAAQEGSTSYRIANAAVTLPNTERFSGGRTVVTFGDEPGDLPKATSNAHNRTPATTPPTSPEPMGSLEDLVAPPLALIGGVVLGVLSTRWRSDRQSAGTRT